MLECAKPRACEMLASRGVVEELALDSVEDMACRCAGI